MNASNNTQKIKHLHYDKNGKVILMSKEIYLKSSDENRYHYVHALAKHYLREAFNQTYDTEHIHVERQSVLDDDWYLYTVCAKRASKTGDQEIYGVWTMNMSIGGLHNGHYDLTATEANKTIKNKH